MVITSITYLTHNTYTYNNYSTYYVICTYVVCDNNIMYIIMIKAVANPYT